MQDKYAGDVGDFGKFGMLRILKPKIWKKHYRDDWHCNALRELCGCDLIFLDPDNGLLPKSLGRGSNKSIKYAFPEG